MQLTKWNSLKGLNNVLLRDTVTKAIKKCTHRMKQGRMAVPTAQFHEKPCHYFFRRADNVFLYFLSIKPVRYLNCAQIKRGSRNRRGIMNEQSVSSLTGIKSQDKHDLQTLQWSPAERKNVSPCSFVEGQNNWANTKRIWAINQQLRTRVNTFICAKQISEACKEW